MALAVGKDPSDVSVSDTSDDGDDGDDNTIDDPTETLLVATPALEVTKTALSTGYGVGDVITYTILVTNTGNVTVDTIELTDTFTDAQGAALALTTGPSFVPKNSGPPLCREDISAGRDGDLHSDLSDHTGCN